MCFTLLYTCIINLDVLQKQVPVHYLSDSNGSILGFGLPDKENICRLIMVADSYENAIYINYDEIGNIKSIINANEQEIQISYKFILAHIKK